MDLGGLIERLRPSLAALAVRQRVPAWDAEDIVQDALVAAVRREATITDIEIWLRGTVWWRCVVYWRQRRRRWLVLVDPAYLDLRISGTLRAEQRDLRIDLRRLCSRLEARQRRLVGLRFGRGMCRAEVARALRISLSTVLREERRALRKLRTLAGPLPAGADVRLPLV